MNLAARKLLLSNLLTYLLYLYYHQTSYMSRTSVDNKIVNHSDVVPAAPTGDAPTTFNFRLNLASMDWAKTTARRDDKHLSVRNRFTYIRGLTVCNVSDETCYQNLHYQWFSWPCFVPSANHLHGAWWSAIRYIFSNDSCFVGLV